MLTWFLNIYASESQKQKIIDKWLIMQNDGDVKTMGILITLVVTLVVVGQWSHYRKKINTKDEEITRLKAESAAFKEAIEKVKIKQPKKGVKK
jgi:uncharacterized membrane protein (DUF106 family)